MVSKVATVANFGFDGYMVEVECDSSKSLPSMQVVGLGNKAIEESKERIKSAITNSLLDFPKKRITINLAPAELPKDGAHYDLPMAVAILCVSGQLNQKDVSDTVFAGELSLSGDLRPIRAAINIAQTAKENGFKKVILPVQNTQQASLITDIEIIGMKNLKDVYLYLKNELIVKPEPQNGSTINKTTNKLKHPVIDDILGQEQAKRALLIAAAGHHNILFTGTPGAGKTMLAKALSNLLPDLTIDEQIEVTKIHSLAGRLNGEIVSKRPFRSPHHTASLVSIIGGGNTPKPGEISLAHTGVLFLDELPEYPRSILESLRQPLEDKKVEISRANSHVTYPSNFMLVATMNPCPCGYYGDTKKECTCTSSQIIAYQKKVSGPMLDRIDMVINVSRIPSLTILNNKSLSNNQHNQFVEKIYKTHEIQLNRYNSCTTYNSSLSNDNIKTHAPLSDNAKNLLATASDKLNLTARSYFKVIKVARTIADLEQNDIIDYQHISEALQYRFNNA